MKISKGSFSLFAAGLASALLLSQPASGQVTAHDDAAAYTNWLGENHGFGFQPWMLVQTGSGDGNFTGFYIGNPGNIGTSGKAFGMYANGSGGANKAAAFRAFSNALTSSQVFKLQWQVHGIGFSTASRGGFNLRNGNTTNSPTDVDTGIRFGFYYVGGGADSFIIADGNGANTIGLPYYGDGLSCEFTAHEDNTYRFVVKNATGTTILYSSDGQPLFGSGTIDSLACYAQQTDGDQVFNNFEISSTSLVPPTIVNVQPTNNSIFLDPPTTQVSFEVDSTFSTVSKSGVTLTLNGVVQTNLVANTASGTNQLFVTNVTTLATNVVYNATIIAVDANGNRATNNFTFNTWTTNLFFVEAEDYNFSAGSFINNIINSGYNQYAGLNGTNGVDFFKPSPGDGGTNMYRPGDAVDMDAQPTSADVDHNGFVANGASDYNISFIQFGEWENYTRILSNVTYDVYARMASLSGNPTMELDHLAATGKATTTNQPLAMMGTFVCPANTGGGQSYVFVPLKDIFSNPVSLRFAGTNTFRTTRIGGSYNYNYLLFVPNTNTATLTPYISGGYPYPGANAGPETLISFTIATRQTAVNPASIQLFLNSNNVTAGVTLSNNAAGTVVTYVPPSFLAASSTNTITAIYTDNGGLPVTSTNTWTFTVNASQVLTLPGADAQLINSGSGPGFVIHIAKAPNASPDADFPTTLARAEAQLSGLILTNGQPYPNLATNGSGSNLYLDPTVINFDINAQSTGTFPGDTAFPYVPASGTNDLMAMDAQTYVQLTNGSYVFLVRSDDGFQLTCGPTPANTNFMIGLFDGGRGNDTPTTMYLNVTNSGLYPMRLLYLQGRFGGNVELYALNRAQNNKPILLNDPNDPNSIKVFQALSSPSLTILNPAHSGNTTTFSFQTQSGHTHYVEYKNALTNATWMPLVTITGNGSTTNVTDNTASPATRFYHVRTQ